MMRTTATPAQVEALQRGESVELLVRIEPQPNAPKSCVVHVIGGKYTYYWGAENTGHEEAYLFTVTGSASCPVAVGDTVEVVEEWGLQYYFVESGGRTCKVSLEDAVIPNTNPDDAVKGACMGSLVATIDNRVLHWGIGFKWRVGYNGDDSAMLWRSAELMPDWAIRYRPTVHSIAHTETDGVHYWAIGVSP